MLLEIPISRNDAGQRTDRFLRKYFPKMGLARLHSLFRRKEIKIAKKSVTRSRVLETGEIIQVYGLKPEEGLLFRDGIEAPRAARPMPPIIFEDDELLVVNKPAGMAAHPGTGIAPGDSLIERVLAYLAPRREEWGQELFSPSLAHRLDKETSGVVLIAKTGERLRSLMEAFRNGRVRKKYLTLVEGCPEPEEGLIDAPLAREDNAAGAKSRVVETGGKNARTRYRVLKKSESGSLLQVIIETGRMHQIRSHLAHIGHSVVGDTRYGRPSEVRNRMRALGLKRLFLHAEEAAFPESKGLRTFHAPLPPELDSVLKKLGLNPA